MTMPPGQEQPPVADPGNSLLAKVPVQLATGMLQTPDGQMAVITFRTASTTLTTMVTPEELDGWIKMFSGLRGSMTKGGLIVFPPGALGQMRDK